MEKEVINSKNIYYPPGGILMWIIIFLELFTFGFIPIAMVYQGKEEPALFHSSRLLLNSTFGAINTVFLLTSGFFMAISVPFLPVQGSNNKRSWQFYKKLLSKLMNGIV